jgi:hypothetical protein
METVIDNLPSWVRRIDVVKDIDTMEVTEIHLYRYPADEVEGGIEFEVGKAGIETTGYRLDPYLTSEGIVE